MLLNLSKLFLALLVLYNSYFQVVFFQIPNMLFILGCLTVLFLLILMYKKSTPISDGFSVETVLWITFAASSLFIGYFIAIDQGYLIASVMTLAQNLILIIAICYISKYDGNINFIMKLFIFLAILCAITTIFWGAGYRGGNQISLTVATNPNSLGILLTIGIFCLLSQLDVTKMMNIVFVSAGTLICLYTIILTASRKSLLAASFLLVYWLLFSYSGALKKITITRRMGTTIIIVFAAISFLYYITPVFNDSVMLHRLTNLFEQGDATRTGMYSEAYEFFLSSPLFGIGYNNYRLLSVYGGYSHSTYAEALANTGFLGVILYFSAYITIAVKTIRIIINKHLDHHIRIQARNILGIFLVMIFLGTGVIHFYGINSSIVFAMIISFNKLHYKTKRKKVLYD